MMIKIFIWLPLFVLAMDGQREVQKYSFAKLSYKELEKNFTTLSTEDSFREALPQLIAEGTASKDVCDVECVTKSCGGTIALITLNAGLCMGIGFVAGINSADIAMGTSIVATAGLAYLFKKLGDQRHEKRELIDAKLHLLNKASSD